MNAIRLIVSAAAIAAAIPSVSSAQSNRPVSVIGSVDYARITEDDGYLGAGFGGSGGVQFNLTTATSIALEVGREHHVRDLGFFGVAHDAQGRSQDVRYDERWEGTGTFVVGVVSHAFGSGSLRPVIWGGGGLMSHGGTVKGPFRVPQLPSGFTLDQRFAETRRGPSSTARVIDGGVGVDVRLAGRVIVRPFAGVRLVNTGNFGPKYIVRGGVRMAFRC
jgi:hypothetical protein